MWVYILFAFLGRLIAGLCVLGFWCVLFPVWFALATRVIGIYALKTAANLFRDMPAPDASAVESIATLWIRGVAEIVRMVFRPRSGTRSPVFGHPLVALQETILATVLFCWLIYAYQTSAVIPDLYNRLMAYAEKQYEIAWSKR